MVAHVVEAQSRFGPEGVLDFQVPLKILGVRHVVVGGRNGWRSESPSGRGNRGGDAGQRSAGLETLHQGLVGISGCRKYAAGDVGCDVKAGTARTSAAQN